MNTKLQMSGYVVVYREKPRSHWAIWPTIYKTKDEAEGVQNHEMKNVANSYVAFIEGPK